MTKVIAFDFDNTAVYEPGDLRRHVIMSLRAFVGMTSDEIKSAWISHGIPAEVIDAGTWDDTKQPFLCIMIERVGAPLLECTFDKYGKCFSQSLTIKAEDVPLCMGQIRKIGFSYSSRNKRWTKPETPYVWRIEEAQKDHYTVTVRRFKTLNK